MSTILITGGAGFIGSHVCELLVAHGHRVVNLDLLTYAGNVHNVTSLAGNPLHVFVRGSICDRSLVTKLLAYYRPRVVFNIAAESHVDRSIDDPANFIATNVQGVVDLLECSLTYWRTLEGVERANFRFIQMSTDEVYGSIAQGEFTEASGCAPNSPYAASKAAGDHFVHAYRRTHDLPIIIVHASNTYGPRQHPEKFIPHMILSALRGATLPVYGDGKNVRDWLHVNDLVDGLQRVVCHGQAGEIYNFAGCEERRNIDIVQQICAHLNRLHVSATRHESLIAFVEDRPGHDLRYAMSIDKVRRSFGWTPATPFDLGLGETVMWYLANGPWCNAVLERGYSVERIGVRA